jgi:hypothetical protein
MERVFSGWWMELKAPSSSTTCPSAGLSTSSDAPSTPSEVSVSSFNAFFLKTNDYTKILQKR